MLNKTTRLAAFAAVVATTVSELPSPVASSTSRGDLYSGSVTIVNNTNRTIYGWSVADQSYNPLITLSVGDAYSEHWRLNPTGGGISIKLSTTPAVINILQYEYTLTGSTIWWDLSCINRGNSSFFTTAGFAVTSDNPECGSAACASGDAACAAAFLTPNDNQDVHRCNATTQMTLTIGSKALNQPSPRKSPCLLG